MAGLGACTAHRHAQRAGAVEHGAREQRLPGGVGGLHQPVGGFVAGGQRDAQQVQRMRCHHGETWVGSHPLGQFLRGGHMLADHLHRLGSTTRTDREP